MTKKNIKTIQNIELSNEKIAQHKQAYKYQKDLTEKLDTLDTDFDQNILNEVVLWKVNRYAQFDDNTLLELNKIKKTDKNLDIDLTKSLLLKLLDTTGVRLAMASTILRFKNPNIYQIIDQRVYRFIYPDKDLTKLTTNKEIQVEVYLQYLIDLKKICEDYNIPFELSDRILYSLDKDLNKEHKIKQ